MMMDQHASPSIDRTCSVQLKAETQLMKAEKAGEISEKLSDMSMITLGFQLVLLSNLS